MSNSNEVKKIIKLSEQASTGSSKTASIKDMTAVKIQLSSLKESVDSFKSKENFSAFWADYQAVRSK